MARVWFMKERRGRLESGPPPETRGDSTETQFSSILIIERERERMGKREEKHSIMVPFNWIP